MIEAAGDLISRGLHADAIVQLNDIYLKCDGDPTPADFVDGTAREELATQIEALMARID